MSELTLDLRACQTVALNLPEDARRRESVLQVGASAGLNLALVEGVRASPGRVGCALSHLRALRAHPGPAPLLVLEDDVRLTEDFSPRLRFPADADALYLGTSNFGAIEAVDYTGFTNLVLADDVDDQWVRVFNLLGAHAILYLSERFRAAAMEAIVESLADRDWAHDRGMARIQSRFQVYALRRAMFYQAADVQDRADAEAQEAVTRVVLRALEPGVIGSIDLGGVFRRMILAREDDGRLNWRWLDT
jgi:hypothetical protein